MTVSHLMDLVVEGEAFAKQQTPSDQKLQIVQFVLHILQTGNHRIIVAFFL